MQMSKKIILFAFLLVIYACAKVPLTGRKQFTAIPSSQINALGVDSYNQVIDQTGISDNQQYIAQVKRVGARITDAVEKYLSENNLLGKIEGFKWEYSVLESDQMNAFCLPGGKIAFYEGIMPVCQDDNGVAVVMSHEIAHAIASHGNERMSQSLVVNLGGMALSEALETQPQMTKDLALAAFGIGSQVGVMLPYSRLHESEADELGLYFMAMAGYDPREAPEFWQRMLDIGGERPPEFLSTHPDPENRIKDLQNNMEKAMEYYQENN
jgi:predicted Zn-dependent protease